MPVALRVLLGRSWVPLGVSWGLLVRSWVALGLLLGVSWGLLGALGGSWFVLGVLLGASRCLLVLLGLLLGPLGSLWWCSSGGLGLFFCLFACLGVSVEVSWLALGSLQGRTRSLQSSMYLLRRTQTALSVFSRSGLRAQGRECTRGGEGG